MGSIYYVRYAGKITGPFSRQDIEGMKAAGKLGQMHEVSQDRQTWVSARSSLLESQKTAVAVGAQKENQSRKVGKVASPHGSQPRIQNVPEDVDPQAIAAFAGKNPSTSPVARTRPAANSSWGIFYLLVVGLGLLLVVGTGVTIWALTRDTWERDNKTKILALIEQGTADTDAGRLDSADQQFKEMSKLVGNRQIQDSELRQKIDDSAATQMQLKIKRLPIAISQAERFAKVGEWTRAKQMSNEVLSTIQSQALTGAEIDQVMARATALKKQAEAAISEAAAAAEARAGAERQAAAAKAEADRAAAAEKKRLEELARAPKGKVTVAVTWKYNDYVGHKPDTDATVVLVPKNLQKKLPDIGLSSRYLLEGNQEKLAPFGAFVDMVGGNGEAKFTKVPAGKYTIIIVSKNTTTMPELQKYSQASWQRYFDGEGKLAAFYKIEERSITVDPGEETTINHDFGITAY